MSILNVNQIQPVGSGQTVTISAANLSLPNNTSFNGNINLSSSGNYIQKTFNNDTEEYVLRGSSLAAWNPFITYTRSTGTATRGFIFGSHDNNGSRNDWMSIWNGSVGIGNTNPGTKLDVSGDIRLSSSDPEIEFNSGGPRIRLPAANTLCVHTGGGLNSTTDEKLRIDSTGSIFVGAYANAYDNPGRFNVSNTSRVTTTSGAYVPSNGGFVDYARFEMISNCVTSFPANNNKIMARNGAPLLINNARDAWSYYTNLPNYLLGSLTHDCINNTSFTVTLACTMTVFLLRDLNWNVVDLTGWTLIESGGQIGVNAIGNARLYVKTLSAGSNTLNNNSAMYFFVI